MTINKGKKVTGTVNKSLNSILEAGFYAIINKTNNKSYIGEAKHLGARIFRHFVELIHNRFPLSDELQKDWNNLNGLENFKKN